MSKTAPEHKDNSAKHVVILHYSIPAQELKWQNIHWNNGTKYDMKPEYRLKGQNIEYRLKGQTADV